MRNERMERSPVPDVRPIPDRLHAAQQRALEWSGNRSEVPIDQELKDSIVKRAHKNEPRRYNSQPSDAVLVDGQVLTILDAGAEQDALIRLQAMQGLSIAAPDNKGRTIQCTLLDYLNGATANNRYSDQSDASQSVVWMVDPQSKLLRRVRVHPTPNRMETLSVTSGKNSREMKPQLADGQILLVSSGVLHEAEQMVHRAREEERKLQYRVGKHVVPEWSRVEERAFETMTQILTYVSDQVNQPYVIGESMNILTYWDETKPANHPAQNVEVHFARMNPKQHETMIAFCSNLKSRRSRQSKAVQGQEKEYYASFSSSQFYHPLMEQLLHLLKIKEVNSTSPLVARLLQSKLDKGQGTMNLCAWRKQDLDGNYHWQLWVDDLE